MTFFAQTGGSRPRPLLLGAGKYSGPALILLAAFVAVLPQLILGNSCGHDFDVHLASWLDCLNSWQHGIPYPHFAPSPNYGAGEPRFVFYPPFTWMLGAALGAILPWHWVPIALTFFILAATGLATRALALEALEDAPATLAGAAAIFSGFALFTAYERSAFPEFAGGFWLPLIVLYLVRDRHPAASLPRRAFDGSSVPLAVALAGAWFSNLPLGVMAGYLLAAVALVVALTQRTWAPILRAALSTLLGLGLAAVYWLPAALERHWVDIRQATEDPGYNFENNWLFHRSADPSLALHDAILRQVSWIALSMIAVALLSALVAWRRGTLPAQHATASRRWLIPLSAIPAAVLIFLFPVSRPLWHLLPQMPFLQYPWRWLEAVEAPMAVLFAAALWPASRRARTAAAALCSLAFLAATAFAATRYFQPCDAEDSVAGMVASYRSRAGFEGMYEYAPPDSDLTQIATGLPDACLVSNAAAVLGQPDPDDPSRNPVWKPASSPCQAVFSFAGGTGANPEHLRLRASSPHPGFLVLRLLAYPAWRVRVNGLALNTERFTALPRRADGLVAVPVPAGSIDIAVDWATTRGVIAARWVSAIAVILLAAAAFLQRRRSKLG